MDEKKLKVTKWMESWGEQLHNGWKLKIKIMTWMKNWKVELVQRMKQWKNVVTHLSGEDI